MHRKLPRCSLLLHIRCPPYSRADLLPLPDLPSQAPHKNPDVHNKIRSRRCRDPNPPAALFQPAFFGYDTIRHAYNRIIPGRIFLCHNICSLMPPFSSVISFKHPGINIRKSYPRYHPETAGWGNILHHSRLPCMIAHKHPSRLVSPLAVQLLKSGR